jgi:hypothetical protein
MQLETNLFVGKCRFLLPGTGEPRLRSLNPRASSFGLSRYIKQREQTEQSYRLQLENSPITSVQSRAKNQPLHPCRSCFAPLKGGSSGVALARI